ncbi:hypothetical protein R6Q59_018513 [Mikania micrantha]
MPSEPYNRRRTTTAKTHYAAGAPSLDTEHLPCPYCDPTNSDSTTITSQPRGFYKACRRKEIFETNSGLLMELRRLRTLKPGSEISIDVIECWAAVLNEEGREAMHQSPTRLFCGPYIFREWMFLRKPLYDSVRLVAFSKSMFAAVGRREELRNLRTYDLVMFPILDNGHFYVMAVDLKEPKMFLIDNMEETESVVSMKDNADYKLKDKPYKVKHFVVEYLHNWKHPKAEQLEDLEITRLQLKWETSGNIKDCGVFTMRHMECFMGFQKVSLNVVLQKQLQEYQTKSVHYGRSTPQEFFCQI